MKPTPRSIFVNRPLRALCMAALVNGWAGTLSSPAYALQESMPISPRGAESFTPAQGSEVTSWTNTGVALGVTLGAVVVGLVLTRRFMPGLSPGTRAGQIEVLSQRALGTRGVVYVLRCGPRVLVVGATPNHMTTLAEIADPDEIDQFRQPESVKSGVPQRARSGVRPSAPAAELKGQLHGMLDKIEGWSVQS